VQATQILEELRCQQVTIRAANDQLALDGPVDVLTDELLAMIAEHKSEILEALRWTQDPRPDFADDSALWTRLLARAHQWDADDPRGLFGALHGFRIWGARLEEREGRLFIRPRPAPEGGWADEAEFQAERQQWLVPHAVALVRLLRAVQEGITEMTWWLRLECAGEDAGRPAAEVAA
jgi:hypothetical protein